MSSLSGMLRARVCAISRLSPSVKHFQLKIISCDDSSVSTHHTVNSNRLSNSSSEAFSFRPGQWVDLAPPGLNGQLSGFSMVSTPGQLTTSRGCFDLAVQRTEFPPTRWMHDVCTVGDEVMVKPGGTFYFDPPTSSSPLAHGDTSGPSLPEILLVAGGVGINPLYCILQHCHEIIQDRLVLPPKRIHLIFSAKSPDELLFHRQISSLCSSQPTIFSVHYFLTRPDLSSDSISSLCDDLTDNAVVRVTHGRLEGADLRVAIARYNDPKKVMCYLCGPSVMVEDIEKSLVDLVPSENIFYENWWSPTEN